MANCVTCKARCEYAGQHRVKTDCISYMPKDYPKPQTNADRIRQMTDYDLADWIAKILDHCENKKPEELCRQSCPLYKCCNDQPYDNIEEWLKSPVEVDNDD